MSVCADSTEAARTERLGRIKVFFECVESLALYHNRCLVGTNLTQRPVPYTPRRSDAQTLRRSDAQTLRRSDGPDMLDEYERECAVHTMFTRMLLASNPEAGPIGTSSAEGDDTTESGKAKMAISGVSDETEGEGASLSEGGIGTTPFH
ncbi:hypothetical protein KIPB_003648 [Kipferlia bialata]|uniref:Uncharacterized protein n=1 Tax=Kipferlia bialata TaxID=797122 RepID=A0A391NN50_9EUKA|nr:hypothetical protein KIPB_003648 [Kipferlia bialata]|eukprot:g3648.t1